jgi:hypothetical protein
MVALAESAAASAHLGTSLNTTGLRGRQVTPRPAEGMVLSTTSFSCGDGEGCVGDTAPPSPLSEWSCTQTLHELSNLMTALVLNAQALECKLPPYSHLKRPVREMSRCAQRSGQLMKQLMRHCLQPSGKTPTMCG